MARAITPSHRSAMASDSAFLMNPAYAVDFAHTYSSSGVKFTYLRGVIRPAFAMGEGNDRLSKSNLVGHEEATWSILARECLKGSLRGSALEPLWRRRTSK
jgi:hypothetical protein